MSGTEVHRRAGVARLLLVHPGFLFIASVAVAGLLDRAVPLRIATHMETRPIQGLVIALIGAALFLFAWCLRTFRRHATSVEPGTTPVALITDGPFARSRNPIYLALLLISIALSIVGSSLWFFGATIALFVTLDRMVITREEKILSASFGETYAAYRSSVRRWV